MIVLSLCIWLAAPGPLPPAGAAPQPAALVQDRGKPAAPSAQAVEQMVTRLKAALKGKDQAAALDAVRAAANVPHGDVVEALNPGLQAADPALVRGTLEALGVMPSPEALKRLRAYAKRERKSLEKDEDLHVLVLQSVARHRSQDTLDDFLDKLFTKGSTAVVKARIFSTGQLRHRDTVERLIGEMRRNDRRRVKNHMRHFQIVLARLTGQDLGQNQDRWIDWWKAVDEGWEVTPKPPLMPEELQRVWDGYWGNQRKYERETERRKRGQGDGR